MRRYGYGTSLIRRCYLRYSAFSHGILEKPGKFDCLHTSRDRNLQPREGLSNSYGIGRNQISHKSLLHVEKRLEYKGDLENVWHQESHSRRF